MLTYSNILNSTLFVFYSICSGTGLLLIKILLNEHQLNIKLLLHKNFLLGIILYAFGFVFWMMILSRIKLSIAFPISVVLVFTIINFESYFILHENLSLIQIIGLILCIIGIILLNNN